MDLEYFKQRKEKAKILYGTRGRIYNPYLKTHVVLNSDGFHHLQFSARRERKKEEQMLKFDLLPLAFQIIRNSGTVQEYRKMFIAIGKKSKRDGFTPMKEAEFWGFVAIVGTERIKIKVVLRRVGAGNIIFWSVMPDSKLKRGKKQKLFTSGLGDD